jgi:raffinose/stachyose/melibiose transport system substrate-binding protein
MVYQGSWMPNEAKLAGAHFPIGSFAFPAQSLPSVFQYGTNINSSADVGGPSAAFQYAIATHKSDQTMTPAKFQAVLDWVRFFSTPQHDQQIVNNLGEFVPTFKGAKPLKSERGSALPKGARYASVFGFSDVSPEAHTRIFNLFQEYVSGHISFAAAKQQYDSIVAQAVSQYIALHHPQIP